MRDVEALAGERFREGAGRAAPVFRLRDAGLGRHRVLVHAGFFTGDGVFGTYPHPLSRGEHCLTPTAVVGGVALVTVNDDDAPLVVDLDALRGRRIAPADVRSPETMSQQSLF